MFYSIDVKFLKKYLVLLSMVFFLFSCKSTASSKNSYTKYLGYWERIDDEAKGDVILIKEAPNNSILASYETISDFAKEYGYNTGDIKFKSVKKIDNKSIEVINLAVYMKVDSKTKKVVSLKKEYVPFMVSLTNNNILKFSENPNTTKNTNLQLDIGKTQKWKKIKN